MALKPCRECKKKVSTEAAACPSCGAPRPTLSKIPKKKDIISELKADTIDQIKNVTQEKKVKLETHTEIKSESKI